MNSNISIYFYVCRYRKTQSALFVRDSMHHGFARSYIDLGQADRLLEILALKV
jgi:hypothetical protein